jgi:hypothetical protein
MYFDYQLESHSLSQGFIILCIDARAPVSLGAAYTRRLWEAVGLKMKSERPLAPTW